MENKTNKDFEILNNLLCKYCLAKRRFRTNKIKDYSDKLNVLSVIIFGVIVLCLNMISQISIVETILLTLSFAVMLKSLKKSLFFTSIMNDVSGRKPLHYYDYFKENIENVELKTSNKVIHSMSWFFCSAFLSVMSVKSILFIFDFIMIENIVTKVISLMMIIVFLFIVYLISESVKRHNQLEKEQSISKEKIISLEKEIFSKISHLKNKKNGSEISKILELKRDIESKNIESYFISKFLDDELNKLLIKNNVKSLTDYIIKKETESESVEITNN